MRNAGFHTHESDGGVMYWEHQDFGGRRYFWDALKWLIRRETSGLAVEPSPTEEQQQSPEFEAVWQAIKSWDINVPEFYEGYCGATGSHVAAILNSLSPLR